MTMTEIILFHFWFKQALPVIISSKKKEEKKKVIFMYFVLFVVAEWQAQFLNKALTVQKRTYEFLSYAIF